MHTYNNCSSNYTKSEPQCSYDSSPNDYIKCKSYMDFLKEKGCSNIESQCLDNSNFMNCKGSSYTDFLKEKECTNYDPEKCKNALLCYQAWMCRCETKLFCDAASRLSYELYRATSFEEVKEIIESISCLFSSSAVKQTALAEVIKSFNCNSCCNCDCNGTCNCWCNPPY